MIMTAVAVQQNGAHRQQYNPRQSPHSSNMSSPHQSRPQSYTSAGPVQMQRQEPPIQNGTSGPVNPRPTVSNDPVQVLNNYRASPSDMDQRRSLVSSGRNTPNPPQNTRDRRSSLQMRPTSAPSGTAESSQDESDIDRTRHRPKSMLQRSKSDFGPRGEEVDSQGEEEWQDWGARHGFEDHYASEEYVSQLANVGRTFLLPPILSPCIPR
ncbi:hypothetical protein G7Y89_g3716 [Cudoniella acicularis]|uniref:Uncharacterized protein n=1 Tax=Cudoniella acicularis TaxID=354080 RepID=A0A8H4RQU0_9HELO|nr:hypothetical protein G7Y89_g3716 [Cudoniella acicularis]